MTGRGIPALLLAGALCAAAGCGTGKKADPSAERRAYAQITRDAAIADLDAAKPGMAEVLEKAPGWAVFSTIGARVFLGDEAGGFGIAHETNGGAETYMRMSEPSYGEGLGAEPFRAVFVFRDAKTFRSFVDEGWRFRADAADPAFDVFQLTEKGRLTPLTLAGTRFWKDAALN